MCSETSTCRWLCPCCKSRGTRYDIDNDPALKDPELDAIVDRQLYKQRAAWNAAHPEAMVMPGHPYAPNIAPPPAAAMADTEKKNVGHGRGSSQGHSGTAEQERILSLLSPVSDIQNQTNQSQSRQSMPMPTHVHTQPGSGPVMMMKDNL